MPSHPNPTVAANFELMEKVVQRFDELKYTLLHAQTFDPEHYGFPDFYYKIMETDHARVNAFRKAFQLYDNFQNKTVCEIGVGTLALTKHYLPYVKKAYLIESNPNVIEFVHHELQRNGWSDRVEFIHGDALQTTLPEQVDYVVGELMSVFCANELQVQLFKHARQFLKPQGKLLPEKIINVAQLSYADFDAEHSHYPIFFTRHLPEIFTTQAVVNTIDLYTENVLRIQRKLEFTPMLSGTINSVYIGSWIQVAKGCNFTGTDSLMPPTIVRLNEPIEVTEGQKVQLSVDFTYGTSLSDARFSATVL